MSPFLEEFLDFLRQKKITESRSNSIKTPKISYYNYLDMLSLQLTDHVDIRIFVQQSFTSHWTV
jgi:hypothetical protein